VKIFNLKTSSQFKEKNLNLTIGNFDGIHLGHKNVIETLINISKKNNYKSAILSFNPHPREFFSKSNIPFNIITPLFKQNLFNKFGIDIYIDFLFDENLSSLAPNEFIKHILYEKLSIKNIIIGSDFKFGKDRKGDLSLLIENSLKYKYKVKIIEPIIDISSKEKFSSSLIREDIKNGLFEKVTKALGRHWHMSGKVIIGDQRARKINFPTANIEPGLHILPLKGVYCVEAIVDKKKYKGIANFGERPTINGSKVLLETHIFNFDKDIYGKELTVEFLTFIRQEQKFDNFEKLTEQIQKDIITAKNYHKI
tara:strand:+ start:2623 stop:3552 length:930 start_codon:yes stop_codon:yes gene_type:complete